MGWYKEALELPSWQGQQRFSCLLLLSYGRDLMKLGLLASTIRGEDSYEVALLDRGIATNHGQMPQTAKAVDDRVN